jgi:hypothetical protein
VITLVLLERMARVSTHAPVDRHGPAICACVAEVRKFRLDTTKAVYVSGRRLRMRRRRR